MNLRFLYLATILAFTNSLVFAQYKTYQKPLKKIILQVELSDSICTIDTLRLFAWTGIQVEPFAMALPVKAKNGSYSFLFDLKNVPLGNYYLGRLVNNQMTDMRPLILGPEENVSLRGTCSDFKSVTFNQSKLNLAFDKMVDSIKNHSSQLYTYLTEYQQNNGNATELERIKKMLSDVDFRRKDLLNKLKAEFPELASIAAVYCYQSFQNYAKENQNEGQYIGESYFQFANVADTNYYRNAYFYEAVKGFASNLCQTGLAMEQVELYLNDLLTKVGIQNPQYKSALLAMSFGVMSANKKLFVKFSEKYLQKYQGNNTMLDNFLQQQLAQFKSSTEIGDQAPNFEAATPDGKSMSLNALRGKVLLVDFWASWCGPCRIENPNVVAVYNKYKAKGFDVLGVSLDNDKQRWLEAIAKDGLTWNHISDLKGWSSVPAQLYKVTGIPFTLLLDRNGVIIAKNLRGPALEEKLREIFGE